MEFFQGNWVDLLILVVLGYFISEAWRVGFWVVLADFLGFLSSIMIAFWGYRYASEFLQLNFGLTRSVSNAIGFFAAAGFSEAFFSYIFFRLVKKIPYKFWKKPWNNLAALFPAAGQGIVIVSFILILIINLPALPSLKNDVSKSRIGGFLITKSAIVETRLNDIFGGLIEDSLTYLTVKPGSRDYVALTVEDNKLSIDETSETEMFKLINSERKKKGLKELLLREELVPIARDHATDMWQREYFGHVSPEGEDVTNRLENAGVSYSVAGENLALAPTVQTAHVGLMNSEGHRENILSPEFNMVGIGVIDNGIYGKLFVQIFTN